MQLFGFLSRSHLVLIALLVGIVGWGYLTVPLDQTLPIHWGIDGAPDGFAPATIAIGLFGLIAPLVLFVLGFASTRLVGSDEYERGRSVISAATGAILVLGIVMTFALVLVGQGHAVNMPKLIVLTLLGLFALLGNYLPKTRPNRLAGLRVRATLADSENWRVTHFWTGRWMLGLALVGILIALATDDFIVLLACVLGAAFVPLFIGLFVSAQHARRERSTNS